MMTFDPSFPQATLTMKFHVADISPQLHTPLMDHRYYVLAGPKTFAFTT